MPANGNTVDRRDARDQARSLAQSVGISFWLATLSVLVAVAVGGYSLYAVHMSSRQLEETEQQLRVAGRRVQEAEESARHAGELATLAQQQAEAAAGKARDAGGMATQARNKATSAERWAQRLRERAESADREAIEAGRRLRDGLARMMRLEEDLREAESQLAHAIDRLAASGRQAEQAADDAHFAREELATAEARAQGVEQRYKQLEARLADALNTARSAIRHARQQQQLSNRNQANAEAALGHAFRRIGVVTDRNSSSNQTTPDLHDYRNLEKRARSARAEAGRALDRAQAVLDDLALSTASQ